MGLPDIKVQELTTALEKLKDPEWRLFSVNEGLLRYYNKAKSPLVLTRSELQLLGLAKRKGRNQKILRYADLVKYSDGNDVSFSRLSINQDVAQETNSEAAQRTIQDKFNPFKALKEKGQSMVILAIISVPYEFAIIKI